MKGGKLQGSSSLSILNIPPMLLPTPQCEYEAITAPSTLMAAGAKGNTSCSSPGANANVGYLQFKRTQLSCKLDEYNAMAQNYLSEGFFKQVSLLRLAYTSLVIPAAVDKGLEKSFCS